MFVINIEIDKNTNLSRWLLTLYRQYRLYCVISYRIRLFSTFLNLFYILHLYDSSSQTHDSLVFLLSVFTERF